MGEFCVIGVTLPEIVSGYRSGERILGDPVEDGVVGTLHVAEHTFGVSGYEELVVIEMEDLVSAVAPVEDAGECLWCGECGLKGYVSEAVCRSCRCECEMDGEFHDEEPAEESLRDVGGFDGFVERDYEF